jgi:hypothetical protein
MDISVEGSVITWLGQALWNGDEKIEAEYLEALGFRLVIVDAATNIGAQDRPAQIGVRLGIVQIQARVD